MDVVQKCYKRNEMVIVYIAIYDMYISFFLCYRAPYSTDDVLEVCNHFVNCLQTKVSKKLKRLKKTSAIESAK